VTDLVSRVRAPTLVLHATDDAVASFSQGRKLAALIPGARFVPLESRNHILLEHEPAWARFVDEVSRFLAEDTVTAAPSLPQPR
jgi:pimeloyl-ACP methyl ester carboxylesterase